MYFLYALTSLIVNIIVYDFRASEEIFKRKCE